MAIDPCRICGEPARVETTETRRRLGESRGEIIEVRVCTSPSCPSGTGRRRLDETV